MKKLQIHPDGYVVMHDGLGGRYMAKLEDFERHLANLTLQPLPALPDPLCVYMFEDGGRHYASCGRNQVAPPDEALRGAHARVCLGRFDDLVAEARGDGSMMEDPPA